jgi:hypothetical protein
LATPASTKLIKKRLERLSRFASVFRSTQNQIVVIAEGDALHDAEDFPRWRPPFRDCGIQVWDSFSREGILQTDGYLAYDQIGGPRMVHAACWAHARKQFFEAVQLSPRDPVATPIVTQTLRWTNCLPSMQMLAAKG